MMDEIEALWSLAEECREWERQMRKGWDPYDTTMRPPGQSGYVPDEFKRLAIMLDDIAKRLAARLPT